MGGGGSATAAGALTQAKDGVGQVVLFSGEAGIGKSRLVQVLKERSLPSPRRG